MRGATLLSCIGMLLVGLFLLAIHLSTLSDPSREQPSGGRQVRPHIVEIHPDADHGVVCYVVTATGSIACVQAR